MIVLDSGEDEGEDRLPYLDTGIVDILAEATGGVGVVLEHRYYGAFCVLSSVVRRVWDGMRAGMGWMSDGFWDWDWYF